MVLKNNESEIKISGISEALLEKNIVNSHVAIYRELQQQHSRLLPTWPLLLS